MSSLIVISALVSTWLIIRLWTVHRKDSWFKKLFWSIVLCVPFFGWLFYGGCYSPLPENSVRAPVNQDAVRGGH